MKCMQDWYNKNYLSLNKSKTQIMHIKKNEISHPHGKILSVTFNNKLKWDEQVTYIVKRAAKNTYLIRNLRSYLPILPQSTKALFYQFEIMEVFHVSN